MIDSIPASLKSSGRFCVWGYRERRSELKKIPFNPMSGAKAKPNDPGTFSTYSRAISAWTEHPDYYNGIGLGIFGDIVGIDIDHCIDENGCLLEPAEDILNCLHSYAEKSPSGTGIHIYCRCPELKYDKEKFYIKNPGNGVELYVAGSTNRFLTMTGDKLNDLDVNDCTRVIMDIAERYMLRKQNTVSAQPLLDDDSVDALPDEEVLSLMLRSARGEKISKLWEGDISGYSSHSEADQALCNYLAFFTRKNPEQMDRLFRKSGLYRDKWERDDYSHGTVKRACDGTVNVWSPRYHELSANTETALEFLRNVDVAHNGRYTHDDLGAGYLLADYAKPFCRPLSGSKSSQWISYDGSKWDTDGAMDVIEEAAKDLCRALSLYAYDLPHGESTDIIDWAGKWTAHNKRKQIIADAGSVYPVSRSDFDTEPLVLNLNNGTLDMRTMKLHEHNPDDLLSRIAPVDYIPGVKCERWESFCKEIMQPSEDEITDGKTPEEVCQEKVSFLQRFLGYCLCGSTKEECLTILYGSTSRNGKSVLASTIQSILGSYSTSINAETLMLSNGLTRSGSAPSSDVARLAGIRMASVAEIPQNSNLDSARVKMLTGGDHVTARFLNENDFTFLPQFKLIMHTNYLPRCTDMSVFDSGRILVLLFSRHFEEWEQDKNLKNTFRLPEAQSGILNWLLAGYTSYLEQGLLPPKSVAMSTAAYKEDGDKTTRFIEDRLCPVRDNKLKLMDVYSEYRDWCVQNGQFADSCNTFRKALTRKGIPVTKARYNSGANSTTCIIGYAFSTWGGDSCGLGGASPVPSF